MSSVTQAAGATEEPGVDPRPGAGSIWRTVSLIAAVVFVLTMALWLAAALAAPSVLERDWVAFDRAADRVAAGDWRGAYADSAGEQFPFLYPPYALWLVLPLSWLGRTGSYAAVLAVVLASMACAALAVRSLVPGGGARATAWLCGSLASGTFLHVVTTGQNTALYVAAVVVGTVQRRRGHARAAGAIWAVLLLKPNLAVVVLAFLVLRRDRRALEGFGLAGATALAVTIPMGMAPWLGFVDALGVVGRLMSDIDNWWGQVTLLAGLRVSLEPLGAGWLAQPLWLAAMLPLGLACVATWWRAEPASALDELRLVGTVCLFTVVANPRLYFYDALLLVVPAAAWCLAQAGSGSSGGWARRGVGVGIGVVVAAGYGPFVGLRLSPLIGPVALGWLVVDLRQLRARRDRRAPAADGGPGVVDATVRIGDD